ncbi:hypothetical protein J5N97_024101 [Dioscorea zingiberensis]|uniref:LisH domain-containing protein n=1 Tax=Dioscorea zingiberensis TaxID=325984 RepID=A0A9D5C6U3_9LILI|nr:hypothetical protein J5N97_024101 [Dioscorea zingiberensis]
MDHQPWDAEKMLKHYIYDYMIKKNLHASAEAFKNEVDIPLGSVVIDDSEGGFLLEWWEIFSELYFSKMTNQGDHQVTIEMIGKRKKPCIEGENINAFGKSRGPSYITNLIPENSSDHASLPFDSSESFEFLQSKDFFATDKNRGLDDFIDLNDVCLEDIEQSLFTREKGDIAEPSSMELKQGPVEEKDAPKGDEDEMT